MNSQKDQTTRLQDTEYVKKSYSTPELLVYGDLREVTRTVSGKNTPDGGKNPNDKTS